MTTNTTTPVLSAIISRAEVARITDKSKAATVARFSRKDGRTSPASKVPEGISLTPEVYADYCQKVLYLYNSACKLNACDNEMAAQPLTSALYTCLTDVLKLIDTSVTVSEASWVCKRLVSDILASAKTVKLQKIGEDYYREENRTINQFVSVLEGQLYTVAKGTTFAADWERDYNRALFSLNNQMKKAVATGEELAKEQAKCRKALDNALAGGKKQTISKAQKAYDAITADVTANAEKQKKITDKKEAATKKYEEAKQADLNAKKAKTCSKKKAVKADETKAA